MEIKLCISCNIKKPLNDKNFLFRNDTQKFRNECKECRAKKNSLRYSNPSPKNLPETCVCKICLTEKSNSLFGKNSGSSNGLKYLCKSCENQRKIQKRKIHRELNPLETKVNTSLKTGMRFCSHCCQNKPITDYWVSKSKGDGLYPTCKICCKVYRKTKLSDYTKKYHNDYEKDKRKNNPIYKAMKNVSRRIRQFIHKGNNTTTMNILGIDLDGFKKHLEQQFKDGMSWDNYGLHGWHIDHIIPISTALTEEDVILLNHYTNLQPLWWYENLSKGNKIL